jgi:hypothetical protein
MRPHEVVRKKNIPRYLPLGFTKIDEIIEQGLLELVPLTPDGRAKGVTMASIINYQRDVMGLEPLPDDTPHDAQAVRHDRELAHATPTKAKER